MIFIIYLFYQGQACVDKMVGFSPGRIAPWLQVLDNVRVYCLQVHMQL